MTNDKEQPAPVAKPHEQEPVAWIKPDEQNARKAFHWVKSEEFTSPVYTSPPTLSLAQRQARNADTWVGLTDEEIIVMSRYDLEYAALIGEVQRKLKEKNT